MPTVKKEKKEDIEWDKKKIIAFLVVGVVLIFLAANFKTAILGETSTPTENIQTKQVKGVSTSDIANGIRQSVQNNLNNIKFEAENLNVAEIASSSPQVQKVLNDLKSLKDVPKNQLKDVCEKVCGRL